MLGSGWGERRGALCAAESRLALCPIVAFPYPVLVLVLFSWLWEGTWVCPVSFQMPFPPPSPGLSTRLGWGHRSVSTPTPHLSLPARATQRSSPGKGDAGTWQESVSSSFLQRSWPSGVAGSPPPLLFTVVFTGHEAPPCPRVGEPHKRTSQHIRAGITTGRDPGPGNRALTVRWLPGLYSQQNCRRT